MSTTKQQILDCFSSRLDEGGSFVVILPNPAPIFILTMAEPLAPEPAPRRAPRWESIGDSPIYLAACKQLRQAHRRLRRLQKDGRPTGDADRAVTLEQACVDAVVDAHAAE